MGTLRPAPRTRRPLAVGGLHRGYRGGGAVPAFLIAGGKGEGVGMRLPADGEEVALWRGKNSERGGWGHIMLDHVILMQQGE